MYLPSVAGVPIAAGGLAVADVPAVVAVHVIVRAHPVAGVIAAAGSPL